MGQRVMAVVYGQFLDDETALKDEDGDWLDGFPKYSDKTGLDPRVEYGTGDGPEFVGISVAVHNVAESSEADMPECALSDMRTALAAYIPDAKKRWKKIAAWAKKHGVTLVPQLLLVEIERA